MRQENNDLNIVTQCVNVVLARLHARKSVEMSFVCMMNNIVSSYIIKKRKEKRKKIRKFDGSKLIVIYEFSEMLLFRTNLSLF